MVWKNLANMTFFRPRWITPFSILNNTLKNDRNINDERGLGKESPVRYREVGEFYLFFRFTIKLYRLVLNQDFTSLKCWYSLAHNYRYGQSIYLSIHQIRG